MSSVFIKRYPSKGEFPIKGGGYYSEKGIVFYNKNRREFEDYLLSYDINIEWWLEEIELPSEEAVLQNSENILVSSNEYSIGFESGAKFILNHLKSNTNGK